MKRTITNILIATVTVITVSVIFALFLGGVDWLLQSGFSFIMN
ncbi:MAG: preprotein translocase subunit SecE [Solobacterium sp.]|nr:preprotein translocase subunit SecE [Solobacterium sp.]